MSEWRQLNQHFSHHFFTIPNSLYQFQSTFFTIPIFHYTKFTIPISINIFHDTNFSRYQIHYTNLENHPQNEPFRVWGGFYGNIPQQCEMSRFRYTGANQTIIKAFALSISTALQHTKRRHALQFAARISGPNIRRHVDSEARR